MARGKKKETLTPEERLQVALVPESEQPYKVPENWCWTYIGCVADVVTGGTPNKKRSEYYGGIFPFFKPADLDFGRHVIQASEYLTDEGKMVSRIISKQSTVVCCIGSIGKCGFLEVEGTTNQQINAAIPKFSPLLLYYYCNTHYFIEELWGKASATTISIVNKSKMECCTFPLPPLTEQQRIVDRIESLFAKLDEAKQKAQDALDNFEIRKAAILHKAFTGELTAQWRKEHGVGMESWENVSVSEICHSLKYGTAKKSVSEGAVVVIRMGNLQDSEINWDDLAYSNDLEDIEKYKLKPGDVLFNRTNSPALVGKTSIYRGEYPAIYAGYLIKLDYDHSRIIGDYLNYTLNTVSAKKYCNSVKTDGVNQSNINAKKIGAYVFAVPKIEEQAEIVRILDTLLAKEQQAKETAEGVLEQIDLIKKAILARAFRGELGTNDPGEESAVELMRQLVNDELG